MKITIDDDVCTGHGLCYMQAPHLVEPDDRGYGKVIDAEVPPELAEEARRAVRACPERAVSVTED
jgi:ferredoxin